MTWAALQYTALGMLCLSMDRHRRQVFPAGLRLAPGPLRCAGLLALAASLIGCVSQAPTAVVWVQWFCLLATLGAAVSVTLTYRPQWLKASMGVAFALVFLGLPSGI
ncbi:DUF3325 domain-containing protein [Pseudomonas sp. dw_358]|uniref:DUF3325 domain-containing protein n=1 Tax=Pseudomonas sp. dw_358 TaxID=2720083 RepID=UPI002115D65D|nr:DUF3325 domain-containing protein [Pseudomonas sp. dw_358]